MTHMVKMAQFEPVGSRRRTEVEKGPDIAAGMAGLITCKDYGHSVNG